MGFLFKQPRAGHYQNCVMEKKDEYLILSILSHGANAHSHTHTVHSFTHTQDHAQPATRCLGRKELGRRQPCGWALQARRRVCHSGSGILSALSPCLGLTPVLGKPPQRWGRWGRNVRHTLLGRRKKSMLHARMRVSEEGGRSFPFGLCSVSLEGGEEMTPETKEGEKENMTTSSS